MITCERNKSREVVWMVNMLEQQRCDRHVVIEKVNIVLAGYNVPLLAPVSYTAHVSGFIESGRRVVDVRGHLSCAASPT